MERYEISDMQEVGLEEPRDAGRLLDSHDWESCIGCMAYHDTV